MDLNVNNAMRFNNVQNKTANPQEVQTEAVPEKSSAENLKQAINDFSNNDKDLTEMLSILNSLNAKNIVTTYQNNKLSLSFELNGKNYIIQTLSQDSQE